ncbi:MAG: DDE-type integrase/transposase/recombinase [Anaerolineales bacterium]|nr:DDE-type integrase/transposase/recombinase [Anaerolineales bacterium]
MTATDAQVRLIMQARRRGKTQTQAAATANLKSRKTVARYEDLGKYPSELKQRRRYRTRADPFAEDWAAVTQHLTQSPHLEAKALFAWLCEQQPERYQAGQLRTFQRRVADWKATHLPQVAVLEQVHLLGEVLQTDGTWLTELGVTVQGQPFVGLWLHCVLPYSNWEWGGLAQSESLLALQLALARTLMKLGHVPHFHQTDHSSAATRQLKRGERAATGQERGYTEGYLHLLAHYGLQPRTTHVHTPQENGDVEASNGGLKRALTQALTLRGSRDFPSLAAWQAFIEEVLEKRNRPRQKRLEGEVAVMKPLTVAPLQAPRQLQVRVNRGSMIRVLNNLYSVPTSLIGRVVTVFVTEWEVTITLGQQEITTVPRLTGYHKCHVNYRHLIDSLLRKPGGFRQYRYREALFPQRIFQQAWEDLNTRLGPRQADLSYLRVLHLAAKTLESDVAHALEHLLATGQPWQEQDVVRLLHLEPAPPPVLVAPLVQLAVYDQLLQEGPYVHA